MRGLVNILYAIHKDVPRGELLTDNNFGHLWRSESDNSCACGCIENWRIYHGWTNLEEPKGKEFDKNSTVPDQTSLVLDHFESKCRMISSAFEACDSMHSIGYILHLK